MIKVPEYQSLKKIIISLTPIIALLISWELLSSWRILNPALFSKPTIIFQSLYEMLFVDRTLFNDINSSLERLFFSFIFAGVCGVFLGLLMGSNKVFYKFFDPIVTVLIPIPGIAWTPIFLVWLGFGNITLVLIGFIAAIFPIIQNVSAATTSIDQKMVWASRSMGATRKALFIKVLLPNSFPYLLTGFKLGLARAWRTIIAVELLAGTISGLGVMIFTAREYLQPHKIYAGIIVLAVLYFMIELVIRFIEKLTIEKWGMTNIGVVYE